MGTPQYVVTRNGSPSSGPGLLDFGPAIGKLHKLEVDKNFHVFYVPIADGKVGELAKLAEELNAASEQEAVAERVEVKEGPDSIDATPLLDVESVGIPTVQSTYMRPGWEPMWILNSLEQLLDLVNEGKLNLVDFKRGITGIKDQMLEDIPK